MGPRLDPESPPGPIRALLKGPVAAESHPVSTSVPPRATQGPGPPSVNPRQELVAAPSRLRVPVLWGLGGGQRQLRFDAWVSHLTWPGRRPPSWDTALPGVWPGRRPPSWGTALPGVQAMCLFSHYVAVVHKGVWEGFGRIPMDRETLLARSGLAGNALLGHVPNPRTRLSLIRRTRRSCAATVWERERERLRQ